MPQQLSSRSNIRNTTTVLAMPTINSPDFSIHPLDVFLRLKPNLSAEDKKYPNLSAEDKISPKNQTLVASANCKFRVSIAWSDDNLACFWLQTHHLQKPGAGLSGLVLVCFQFFKFAQRSQLNPQVSLSALQLNLIFFFS